MPVSGLASIHWLPAQMTVPARAGLARSWEPELLLGHPSEEQGPEYLGHLLPHVHQQGTALETERLELQFPLSGLSLSQVVAQFGAPQHQVHPTCFQHGHFLDYSVHAFLNPWYFVHLLLLWVCLILAGPRVPGVPIEKLCCLVPSVLSAAV